MTEQIDALKRSPEALKVFSARVRLRRDGKEYVGQCCFHSEKTGSLRIFNHDGCWLAKCFGCGWSGNAIQFVEKFEQTSFKEALEIVQKEIGGDWARQRQNVDAVFKPLAEDKPVKTYTLEQFQSAEKALEGSQAAKDFLARRGISYSTARKLHFGFRQDVGKLAGKDNQDIADKGWLAIPCVQNGRVVSIEYRSVARKAFCRQPGMATALFNTDHIDPLEPVYLAEGKLDVAVLEQAGFRAVSLASASTKLSPADKDLLLTADCVYLAGDTDAAGTEAMARLWNEMQERTYLLKWPLKDANETFLTECGGDVEKFRARVEELSGAARSTPMAGVRSLPEMMTSHAAGSIADHPNRFRFPWKNVDEMAIVGPGSVIGVTATSTGQGKTSWTIQATLEAARRHGEVVINYQAELTEEQVSRIVAAQVLKKNRLELTQEDFRRASEMLGGVKYYVGRNPVLTTIEPVLDLMEAAIRRLGATTAVLDNLAYLCRNEKDQTKAQENAMQRVKSLSAKHGTKFFVLYAPKKPDSRSKGKQLHISDVRGSATQGDDADVVYFLHRESLTGKSDNKKDDYDPRTTIRLGKVRDKGPGDAETSLMFIGDIATFSEIEYGEPFTQPDGF